VDQSNEPTDGAVLSCRRRQRYPYYLYGSQQDSSSVAIATRSDTESIDRLTGMKSGREAGYIAPYLPDPDVVYGGDYEALITRFE